MYWLRLVAHMVMEMNVLRLDSGGTVIDA